MTNDPKLDDNVHVLLLTKVGFLPVPKWTQIWNVLPIFKSNPANASSKCVDHLHVQSWWAWPSEETSTKENAGVPFQTKRPVSRSLTWADSAVMRVLRADSEVVATSKTSTSNGEFKNDLLTMAFPTGTILTPSMSVFLEPTSCQWCIGDFLLPHPAPTAVSPQISFCMAKKVSSAGKSLSVTSDTAPRFFFLPRLLAFFKSIHTPCLHAACFALIVAWWQEIVLKEDQYTVGHHHAKIRTTLNQKSKQKEQQTKQQTKKQTNKQNKAKNSGKVKKSHQHSFLR